MLSSFVKTRAAFSFARAFGCKAGFKTINVEKRGNIGCITLNRPKALNALSTEMLGEIMEATKCINNNPNIGAIVISGSERAFAAGADVKEMAEMSYVDTLNQEFLKAETSLGFQKKPVIAAVNGFALGGGCELAMACDIIIAGEGAKFGQPEVKLGITPGLGGTQRLVRAIGKSRAMELVLTGDMIDAEEAKSLGLVSRIVPKEKVVEEAMKTAAKIASLSKPVIAKAKASVQKAQEVSLQEGLDFERELFHSCFALEDRKEGMDAFLNKRTPQFKDC
eukprot:TRINITY_DN805_c0_g4_i1.p1 TRINITY_DN805_c0_g4~~TRINITY_DN805_c0_g4_i1.p1  ORF type:complete len:279 (+),score=95.75 TRINITY_DN805_c0_g4_i1:51-887(+)